MKPISFTIDSKDPDLSKIRDIARGARDGKLTVFPTEAFYVAGVPMSRPGASEKVAAFYPVSSTEDFEILIGEWEMLDFLKVKQTPAFKFLSRQFWPGPVVLKTLNDKGEKFSLRFPAHRIATALINASGEPFRVTEIKDSSDISKNSGNQFSFDGKADYVLQTGITEYKRNASVVDLTQEFPVLETEGAKDEELKVAIEKVKSGQFPRKRILVVCTGNSCRSPMAEGWLKDQIKRKGLSDQIEVFSCGVAARTGMIATSESVYVMKNREIDISEHKASLCSKKDMLDADLIIAMSPQHSQFIYGMVPSAKDKIKTFDVEDPIGMSMPVYEQVAAKIEQKLKELWPVIVA